MINISKISLAKLVLLGAVIVPVLTACQSSAQNTRPVSNLKSTADDSAVSSATALKSNSGVQVYGTIDAGYGYSQSKTKVKHSDGRTETIRSSHNGVHSR